MLLVLPFSWLTTFWLYYFPWIFKDSIAGSCLMGWLGRLVFFYPTHSLKLSSSQPFFCCKFDLLNVYFGNSTLKLFSPSSQAFSLLLMLLLSRNKRSLIIILLKCLTSLLYCIEWHLLNFKKFFSWIIIFNF